MLYTHFFYIGKQRYLLVYSPDDNVEKRLFKDYEYIGKLSNINFENSFSMSYDSFENLMKFNNILIFDIRFNHSNKLLDYTNISKQFTYIFKC